MLPKSKIKNSDSTDQPTSPRVTFSRLISSISRQPSDSATIDSDHNDENFSLSSLFFKPLTKRILPGRKRSTSQATLPPDSPSIPNQTHLSPMMHNSSTTPADLNNLSATNKTNIILPTPETIDSKLNFNHTYKMMIDLATKNCNYFAQEKNSVCQKFHNLLAQLLHALDLSIPLVHYLIDTFSEYDYSPEVKQAKSQYVEFFLFVLSNRFVRMDIEH